MRKMGALRQLGSLFWKNYIIRKRHPAILCLEILWPVLMFVLVGVLRTRIPPKSDDTCSYPERALPGTDLVPFLQTSVCTLNNECRPAQNISDELAKQQRFQAMVADISPLLTKTATINAVKALPTVKKVLQLARNITNGTDLNDLDERLKMRNMFSKPDQVVGLLVDNYKVMSRQAAEDLMDSSFNILKLVETIGTIDFKGIVCNPDTLRTYILFPGSVDVKLVSNSLCAIDQNLVSNITNDIVRMLDVPNIIRLAEDFANIMGEFDYALFLEDIANMIELVEGRSSLASIFTDFKFLSLAPSALRDVAKLIPILTSMQDIDFESIEAVYDILKPMILTLSDDEQMVQSINEFLEAGNTLLEAFTDPNADWSEIIGDLLPLLNETENLIADNGTLNIIFNNIPDISQYIDMFMNNESIAADSLLSGIGQEGMDLMMRMVIGNETMDTMMIVSFGLMDMMDAMIDFFKDMDESLRYSIETNPDMRTAMTTLYSVGSQTTGEFLQQIISLENIREIYKGTTNVETVCNEAVDDVLAYLTPEETNNFKNTVCSSTVTEVVETSMSEEKYTALQTELETIMTEMDQMMLGNISLSPDMTMDKMAEQINEMTTKVTGVIVNMTADWDTTLMKVVPDWQMLYEQFWRQMWMDIGWDYMKANLLTQLETSLKTLERTIFWKYVDNGFFMADSLMGTLRKYMDIAKAFMDEDSTAYAIASHIRYVPDLLEGFLKNTHLLSKVILLEDMTNLTAVVEIVCAENWRELNVSTYVPINNIETLVCEANWTKFMKTIFIDLHPFSFLKEIEDGFFSPYYNGINWTEMINNLNYHLSLFTNGEVEKYISLWTAVEIYHIEDMLKPLQRIWDYSMKQNAADYITNNKEVLINSLENLDRQMGDWATWREVKHYIYVVVMYHKVVNRYLADTRVSGFNATLYIVDISPTLGDFLLQSASTVPELLDGLQYAMVNIYNTLNIFLMADFTDLCNSININELLRLPNNENVRKFKEELCALNWTQIGEEFMDNDDSLQQIYIELEKLTSNGTSEPINMNWTDIVSTVEEFISLLEATVTDEQSFVWDALNLDAINGSYTDLANNIWNLPEYDVNWQLQAMNQLADLLYQQNDPMMADLMFSLASQTYLNYHFNVFLNIHLEYFTSHSVVDLRQVFKSSEMDKVFDVLVKSPDLIKIIQENLGDMIQTFNYESTEFLDDIMSVCNKSEDTLSSVVIPSDVTLTTKQLQMLMCSLELNSTKLIEELVEGLDGFKELLDSIELLGHENVTLSDIYVNLTTVQEASNMTAELFEHLISNPPNISIGSTDLIQWVEDVVSEFEVLITNLTSVNTTLETLVGSLAASQQQLTGLYLSLFFTGNDTNSILRIMDMYTIVLQHMLVDFEGFLKEPDFGFKDYPEMKKLWELLEQGPHVMETFIYTSVMDNEKITKVTALASQGLEELCQANPDDLMTVPPESDFDFTALFSLFCSINMTSFEEEYTRFLKLENISAAYDSLDTDTREVNMTALNERIQSITEKILRMFGENTSFQIPFNETAWNSALEFVGEMLMNMNTSWEESLLAAQQQTIIATLASLNELGEINGILKVAELYLILMDKMVMEGKDLLNTTGMGLEGYPQMYTIWQLMEELPDVLETFMYTSYMDSIKLTKFTELVVQGVDKLCEANPEDLMTVPPQSSFNFTAFFHTFCTINMTELEDEYSNFTNREEINYVWDNVMSYNETVNITIIIERYDSLMTHLNDLMSVPENLDLPRFVNSGAWEKAIEAIADLYANYTNIEDILLTTQQQSISSLLTSMNEAGEINGILKVAELYMMLINKMVMEGKDLVTAPSVGLEEYPQMYIIWRLMEELPEVLETFIYTSYMDNLKISKFTELVVQGVDKLCEANPEDLMTVPPQSSFNFTAFFHTFCTINMTELEDEYSNFTNREEINYVWENVMSYNKTVNVSSIIEQYESLMAHLDELMRAEHLILPTFVDNSAWDKAVNTIMEYFENNTDWVQSLTTTSGLDMINDTDMARVGLTVDLALDLIIDRLQQMTENLTVELLMQDAPDLVLMVKSMSSLNVALQYTTLKEHVDEDKVMELAMNPETMITFCENNSLASYIMIPGSMESIATDVANILCVVMDTDNLVTSLQNQVDYDWMEKKLTEIWNMSKTEVSYDWDIMTTKLTSVTELLTNITSSPPYIDPVLTNLIDMEGLFNMLSEMASSPALYAALSRALSPLTGDQAIDASGISSVIMYIIEMIEKNDWNIPINALLPDSSSMALYIEEFLSTDSYETLMLATLNPQQFWMLVLSGDWEMTVCDLDKFSSMFEFPDGVDVTQLQTDLCNKSKSQNLNAVFRSIDVAEITNQLGQYIANLTSEKSTVDAPMTLESLANYTATLLNKLMSVGNSEPFDIDDYFKPITDALMNLTPTSASIESVCSQATSTISGLGDYQTVLNNYLHTVYLSFEVSRVFLSIQNELGEVLCDPEAKNVSILVVKIKEKEIPEKLQFLAEVYTGKFDNVSTQFTCEGIASLYTNYTEILTNTTETIGGLFNTTSETQACLEDTWSRVEYLLIDMSRLFAQGSQIVNVLQEPQLREFLYTIMESNATLDALDQIVNLYREQQNNIDAVREALQSNVTDLLSSFEENYNIAPDILRTFVNSTLDRDFTNSTTEEVLDYICNSSSLDAAILMDANFQSLKDALCAENGTVAPQTIEALLQLGTTLNRLQGLPIDSQDFYEVLTNDLSDLVSNIQGISELASIIDDLDSIDITNIQLDSNLLDTLQRILLDSSPDDLYNSLNAVISNFADINGDSSAEIVKELQVITEGLFAFRSLRAMLIDEVKMSDIVDSPTLIKYMIEELGLPREVAQAIMDGSISFKTLLDASSVNITNWVCNSTQLSSLITLPDDTTTDIDYISDKFCSIDTDTISKLLEKVLVLVDIGDLIQEYVDYNFYNLLEDQGLSVNETKAALEDLQKAQADLKLILETADEYTSQIPNAVAALTAAQSGSSQTMESLSAILCGTEIEVIDDDFNLNTAIKSTEDLSDDQRVEMETLPGPYCQDLYMEVMSSENGPIIWAYLKPLLRGKILYCPNTPEMAQLMSQVNSTFATIEDVMVQARDWAAGSDAFTEVTGDNGDYMQELLDSQLVGGIITDIAGMSSEDIKDLVYTLNGTDPDFVDGLSHVAKLVGDYIDCIDLNRFVGFDTEKAMDEQAARLHQSNELLAALTFDLGSTDRRKRDAHSTLPNHIKYKIRMDIDMVQHTYRLKERMWRPKPEDSFAGDLRYLRGFIQIQQMIDGAIIASHFGTDFEQPMVSTKQFPFPCHKEDVFINAFAAYLLPIMMTIAWLAGISIAVYNLVYDRENGQEETLKAMGLTGSLNWWAWFMSTMLICSAIAFIDAVIMKYWNVFTHSNLLIIILYFVDFIFSAVMLSYFVSAFFTRTALAILASLVVYLISYLPYVVLISLEVEMEFYQKFIACLSSTTAFSFGAHFIARYEEQLIGVQWYNADESPLHDDNFSFQWACIMMVIDGVIYMILGWYVRNVKPGKFGIAQPWYFPVSPYYYGCGSTSSSSGGRRQDIFSEEVVTDYPVVISMRGLSKKFSGKQVVDNLSLDIHAGHVTALLGHNGAAKTTTMNMLIGVLEPSCGEVRIFNRPQRKMRESIGVCPQHNALFEYMTVKEHMEFYASIKSRYPGQTYTDEIKELLKDVDLWWCRHYRVKQLSGGMQRRLCVALAFVGGSRAVILDEPTSGVDPSGRRAIWNLIIKRKIEAAILLSTHHLDEADILGDNIAIMHEGKLLCSGSPMFLKQHLTQGHRLTVIKDVNTLDNDPPAILSRLQKWVPLTRLLQIVGHEMTFVLPNTNSKHFYSLLQDLEMNKQQLMIDSYGVSDPTLEEVFLKVCKTADVGQVITPDNVKLIDTKDNSESTAEWKHNVEEQVERLEYRQKGNRVRGASLKLQQFGALLTKRFNHYRRNWRVFISVLILPLLLFLIASGFYFIKPKGIEAPSILLSPATYGPDSYIFYKGDPIDPLTQDIINSFEQYPGIGTTCMAGFNPDGEQYQCVSGTSYRGVLGAPYQNRTCTCSDYEFKCTGYMTPPREMVTTTSDILQNLESRDIEKYILDTFHDYIEKRYGGWSFEKSSRDKLHAKIWYNNKGHHALPSFLNAYSNGLLRALVNKSHESPSQYGITAYTHPYLFSEEQLGENTLLQHAADAGIALTILIAFTFFPVGVMMYVMMERLNKDKHLQSISGVGPVMYWLAAILWDMIVLIVAVAVTFGIIAIFRHDSFWNKENAPATVVLLLLYGWSTIPLTYCFVRLFKTAAAAFFTMFCTYNFLGIASISLIFVMDYFTDDANKTFEQNVENAKNVLLMFPQYALSGGLLKLIENEIRTNIFAKFNTDVYVDPFSFDMLAWNMIVMAGEGLLFLFVAILLEMRCNSCESISSKAGQTSDIYEDVDVLLERRRVQEGHCQDDILVVRDLYKVYPGRDVYAVSGISFGVPKSQCFGLLGVNGAGKTTTFKMLTGTIEATRGEAWLLGNSVKNASIFGKTIGYCPQEEALDVYLTVEEMLAFHCNIKGIPSDQHETAINSVMDKLGLHNFKHKTVKSCSGGMKRKVSLAIALLGDPPIVLLDEPTTGMDPKAKRLVWDCLLEAKKNGQAIVLTSHSLEECDILCDRIAIMVNGEFKCLGSSQHLKNKFGEGYTLTLNVVGLPTIRQSMHELVQKHFPGATIRDQHQNIVQLDIPKHSTSVSDIFGILEAEKHRYNIVYYTVSQTTLDTIFLNFARDQGDGSAIDTDTEGTSSIESYSNDNDKTTGTSIPTAYFAYQNKMYDTLGDSEPTFKPRLVENKYLITENDHYSTKL